MKKIKWLFSLLGLGFGVLALAGCPSQNSGPSSPDNNSPAPTTTFTDVFSATPSSTATKTATSTPTSTFGNTATTTPTATVTSSPTATASPTVTGTPTSTASPTVTDTPTATPLCFMGSAPVLGGDFNTAGLAVFLFRYQAPATGSIYGMTGELLSTTSSDFYQYGVYGDDGAGNPTNLLGSTAIIPLSSAGAFDIQSQTFGSPIPITGGNYYWLAFLGNVALYDDNSTSGQFRQITVAGGPTPMPSNPALGTVSGLATGQPVFYLYASTCP